MNKILTLFLSTATLLSASAFATDEAVEAFKKDAGVQRSVHDVMEQIRETDRQGVRIAVGAPNAVILAAGGGIVGGFARYLVTQAMTPQISTNPQSHIVSAEVEERNPGGFRVTVLNETQHEDILKALLTPQPVYSKEFAAQDALSAFRKNAVIQQAIQQTVRNLRGPLNRNVVTVSEPTAVLLRSGSGFAGITSTSLVTVAVTAAVANAPTHVIAAIASRIGNSPTSTNAALLTQAQLDAVIRALSPVNTAAVACETAVAK